MREALISKVLSPPKYKYSQLVKAGPHYVCSGMIAIDNASGELISGGVEEQTRKIFSNLAQLMNEFSLVLEDMLIARIYTTEFEKFAEINAAWETVFTQDMVPPARCAVGVNALPLGAKVEIEFSFYREDSRLQ